MNHTHCDICDRPLTWWDRVMGRGTCGRLACQKVAGTTHYYDGRRRPRSAASSEEQAP